ncbi:MAG: DUF1987 domain-containing protein [Bacteroidales bacterium]|nr:DUF1987 domain-containing protein [Bacteroidales bacterium]
MESLIIKRTEDTPEVEFSIKTGVFKISGRSLPENAIEFYKPIFAWVDEALKSSANRDINVEIRLEYFNTASSKQIAKLFLLLENFIETNNISIKWYYEREDNDMLISGSQYAKFLNLSFTFIEFDSDSE